ncbi:hypothetical protein Tco_1353567 [Tanacetum coccineum]
MIWDSIFSKIRIDENSLLTTLMIPSRGDSQRTAPSDALSSTTRGQSLIGYTHYENLFEVTNFETMEKNVKKTTNASLILEDLILSLSLPFHKEVPRALDNEDKVFNLGILIHENLFEVTNFATPDKNVKKATNASLILEDFNPPLYELPFHKEVLGLGVLLSFSSENEEKVYNPGILTSKRVHTSLLPELSHRSTKTFKVTKILESPVDIFPCSHQENIRVLDVPCLHFYPL